MITVERRSINDASTAVNESCGDLSVFRNKVKCEPSQPKGREVDTRHDELIVVCPTTIALSIRLRSQAIMKTRSSTKATKLLSSFGLHRPFRPPSTGVNT